MLKTRLLFFFFLLIFTAILGKLFYIQVIGGQTYAGDYLQTKKVYPERGKIFDRNMEPIVINQPSYNFFIEPKKIGSRDETIYKVDKILKIGDATLEAKIDPAKDWVSIKNGLTKRERDLLLSSKLKGIGFDEDSKRFYPESSLSAHLLGFVGKNDEGENVGYFGVEGFYEKDLAGLPGLIKSERDMAGKPIFVGTQERIDPENGRDLVLTIDKAVQNIIKKKLQKAMEVHQPKQACIIVANPKTMEILGLSCLPDFDPDKYYEFTEDSFKNPALSDLYEPGSIFKPLVMAVALEEKAIKPDEMFDEEGPVQIGEYKIKTWNEEYEGKISMTRIMEKSSNVGMVYIGKKLGASKLYKYIQDFGFGSLTNIDLQGEVAGQLKPKEEWYPIDYSTATFGQGIAVTPIQMIYAFSSIINGGNLITPHVVHAVIDGENKTVSKPKVVKKLFSERTSEIVKKMLVSTVDHGEYKYAIPEGYKIGGKTGTAQIPIAGHYDPSKTIASFIGFAPADDPKFIALVMLKEPQSSIWGSETAAPLFFEIAKDLLVYYNITPDKK